MCGVSVICTSWFMEHAEDITLFASLPKSPRSTYWVWSQLQNSWKCNTPVWHRQLWQVVWYTPLQDAASDINQHVTTTFWEPKEFSSFYRKKMKTASVFFHKYELTLSSMENPFYFLLQFSWKFAIWITVIWITEPSITKFCCVRIFRAYWPVETVLQTNAPSLSPDQEQTSMLIRTGKNTTKNSALTIAKGVRVCEFEGR